MIMTNPKLHSAALATILSLAVAPAFAQNAESEQAPEVQNPSAEAAEQAPPSAEGTTAGESAGLPAPDAVVATVGDAEIRGSDVTAAIGLLPPQLQAQPPQMLVPIALEQLILRELILQEARDQNLQDDAEVTQLVEQTMRDAEDNALVQIWLERETATAVGDDAVQSYYDEAKAQSGEDFPPLEEVRPQIEQHLRQQQMEELRADLREGADIVVYDASGQPIENEAGTPPTTDPQPTTETDPAPEQPN